MTSPITGTWRKVRSAGSDTWPVKALRGFHSGPALHQRDRKRVLRRGREPSYTLLWIACPKLPPPISSMVPRNLCGPRHRPGQFKELLRHGFHGALDFRGERRTKGKLLAFNAVNQQGLRQTVHSSRQFDRLAHAESMRGTEDNIFRQPVGAGVPYPNLTGRSAGGSGVD